MSDDDFGDDSFFVDDSFLREVDHIAASAQSQPQSKSIGNGFARSVSLQNPRPPSSNNGSGANSNSKGWTGVQRSFSGPSSKPLSKINSTPNIPSSSKGINKAYHPPFGNNRKQLPPQPSSDDYDILPIEPESLAALDSVTTHRQVNSSASTSKSSGRPNLTSAPIIPSSKIGFGRTSSNGNNTSSFGRTNSFNANVANSNFLQTHLNFRREKQSTKGKVWDRTEFAETGRRIGNEKGKGKSKAKGTGKKKSRGWDDDNDGEEDDLEEDEDEDDWGSVMAPAPKPFVDMNAPYEPQRHLPNSATIGTYIYPTNRSKREYQYEIIRACFKDNCLVALPTGLGKTFVAGVVMLNFYRWFPTGKIVFLAPTKPLVNQQIEACQLSCGIPSKDAAVMTGQSVSAKERARLWEDRRVFYCTPQTLDNDLKKGSVDPRDIVLAVFDEAHKASGSYAYTTILAYITAHHPYFRVLALTATPGADVPRVQSVVDALHISRIEIREAEAPEIRKYMNEKRTDKHVVPMGDVIENFRDRWAAIMRPNVVKLVEKEILNERDLDCKRLRPFRLTAKRMEIGRDRNSSAKWAFGSLTALEKQARAMGHLLEFSLGMFHTTLVEIAGGTNASGKKSNTKGSANSVRNNTDFQKLLRDVEIEMNMIRIGKDGRTKADKHPKMQKTLELLLAHFTQAEEEEKTLGQKNDTRAMVFCSFRECVLDIVDMLNQHSGLLRATKFVGQSQGKQEEDKGFNQKEQKRTINEFKDGKYNILVSTSIGEEGLDIGEVDFVVIYDMPKQSIKLLQRIGRTGRKRDGKVHVLMSENREDMNWETAQQTHRDIQEEILHSRNLELFEDVEPLLPNDGLPECIEQEMEIDPWDPEDKKFQKTLAEAERLVRKEKQKQEKANGGGKGKSKGQSKDKGRGHEVPEGADGFTSVADLLRSAGKLASKKTTKGKSKVYSDLEDDDGEPEEEEEVYERPKKRKSTGPVTSAKPKKRGREPSPIRSDSDDDEGEQDMDSLFAQTDTRNKAAKPKQVTTKRSRKSTEDTAKLSTVRSKNVGMSLADIDLNINGHSDSEDEVPVPKKLSRAQKAREEQEKERQESEKRSQQEQAEKDRSKLEALDFFNSIGPIRRGMTISPSSTPPSSPPPFPSNMDKPEEESILPPSPEISKESLPSEKLTPRTAAAAGFSQIAAIDLDLSWDYNDDFDEELVSPLLRKTTTTNNQQTPGSMLPPPIPSSTINNNRTSYQSKKTSPLFLHPGSSSPFNPSSSSGIRNHQGVESSTPLPPTQFPVRRIGLGRPRKLIIASASSEKDSPYPTKRTGAGLNRNVIPSSEPDSPVVSNLDKRRKVIIESSSPIVERSRTVRRNDNKKERNGTKRNQDRDRGGKKKKNKGPIGDYVDMDAALSGSDSGDSSEHSESSIETESDRRFANDFQPTQAPKGYNQQAIYLAGLGTQARGHGLNFKRDFGDARKEFLGKARKAVYITDDEDDGDHGLNFNGRSGGAGGTGRRGGGGRSSDSEYELGSFVVDDDEEDL